MRSDARFTIWQPEDRRQESFGPTAEPPYRAALREGNLLGVTVMQSKPTDPRPPADKASQFAPSASTARPTDPKPPAKVDPAERDKAALLAQQAELAKREAAVADAAEAARLRRENSELAGQIERFEAELDRRAKGGLQSRIRLGEFARNGSRVRFADERKTERRPKRQKAGFASRFARRRRT